MNLIIKINTDNAAFDDGRDTLEVTRILSKLTSEMASSEFVAELDGQTLRDTNGNICGNVRYVK